MPEHLPAPHPSRARTLAAALLFLPGALATSTALAASGPYEATLGAFHVRHEHGSVSMKPDRATLSGTVYLWPSDTPSLQLRLRNATVTGVLADASRQTSGAQAEELELKGRGPTIVWSAMQATGALEIVAGAVTAGVVGGQATVSSTADGTAITLDAPAMNVLGCVHQVGAGSRFAVTGATLLGTLQCAGTTITGSTLELSASGAGGQGTVKAHGQTFDLRYRLDGSVLTMTGERSGTSRGWQPIPGVPGAAYQVTAPRVRLTLTSAGTTAHFEAAAVQTRSIARRLDGQPAATAALADVDADVSPDGSVALLVPGLPAPPLPPSSPPLCNASCPEIKDAKVSRSVPSGTHLGPLGSLEYADRRQGECYVHQRVIRLAVLQRGPMNGACRAETVCAAGDEKFSDGGVWRCREPIPVVPTLPVSVLLRLNDLME